MAQPYPPRPAIPSALVESAVDSAKAAFPNEKEKRLSYIDGYCSAFMDHFRYGSRISNLTVRRSDEAWMTGRKAGLESFPEAQKEQHLSPLDFGYTIQSLTGTYAGGFETNHFRIKGTGERLEIFLGTVDSLPVDTEVTIQAYVSPESLIGVGHFNAYKRSIIVMKHEK